MAATLSSFIPIDLGDILGALLVATVISSCLYGVACLQTWYYFQNYHDQFLVRGIVLALLVLETIHAILAIHAVYYYLILNFGNLLALMIDIWSLDAIIPLTVRLFLNNAVWKLI
ncbi:hypothetical protein Moror_15066 [Moniliophthora roreri MCA 2997]|uniref:Uncharacterized protein n=2 Tax=Moniliophthora roreri TaxID=221103 RepID=V2WNX7_MONRO|nr:hypothetical protein Moror_15066 [Moniliophthora roreri MCA 2997]